MSILASLRPNNNLTQPDAFIAAGLFLTAFVVFALIAPKSFLNGDMPVYAEQIRSADFGQRTTHLAYYLIGYVWLALDLFQIDHALNLLSTAFAAATVVVVYGIALDLTRDRAAALASALVLFVNDALLIQAVHAEVYMPQTFFAVAALLAWMRNRPVLAGTLFACAFLISASSAFFLAAFPLLRRDPRAIFLASVTAAAITAAALLPVLDNYIFGPRGLAAAAGKSVDLTMAALKNGRDVFFGFYTLTPFLISGTLVTVRDAELRPFAFSIGLAWLITLIFGEKFADVPVQLPVYCLLAVLTGIGATRLKDAGRAWPPLCIFAAVMVTVVVLFFPVPARIADHLPSAGLLYGFAGACVLAPLARRQAIVIAAAGLATAITGYARVIETTREADEFARMSRAAYAKAPPGTLFVGEWNAIMRFNWNARRKTYTDDTAFPRDKDRIDEARRKGRPIWSVSEGGIGPRPKS